MNILTIDIGGTTTKRAIINDQAVIVKRYPTIKTTHGHDLTWLFDKMCDIDLDYDCIAIDVPGFYSKKNKIITLAGNLNYRNFDIDAEVKKHTNKPCFILNDANAAALGEFWHLGENTYQNALFYILGTGIGGGIILNGELYEGAQGYAGEFGHGKMFDDLPCTCGLNGCYEQLSSAKGITNRINEYAKSAENKALHELYLKKQLTDDKIIHLNEINHLLDNNDKATIQAISDAIQPLIKHMSLMTYALNPEIIIIGGGPTNYGNPFLKIITDSYVKAVADWLLPTVDVVLARKLNDAALYGGAFYALKNYTKII